MSGTTDRLRSESTNWSFHSREPGTGTALVWAMLDVIDAAETIENYEPGCTAKVCETLARFREVAG